MSNQAIPTPSGQIPGVHSFRDTNSGATIHISTLEENCLIRIPAGPFGIMPLTPRAAVRLVLTGSFAPAP